MILVAKENYYVLGVIIRNFDVRFNNKHRFCYIDDLFKLEYTNSVKTLKRKHEKKTST